MTTLPLDIHDLPVQAQQCLTIFISVSLKKEFGWFSPSYDLVPLGFMSTAIQSTGWIENQCSRLGKVGECKKRVWMEGKDQRKQLRLQDTLFSSLIPLLQLTVLSGYCHSTFYSSPLAHEPLEGRYDIVLIFLFSVSSTGPSIKQVLNECLTN